MDSLLFSILFCGHEPVAIIWRLLPSYSCTIVHSRGLQLRCTLYNFWNIWTSQDEFMEERKIGGETIEMVLTITKHWSKSTNRYSLFINQWHMLNDENHDHRSMRNFWCLMILGHWSIITYWYKTNEKNKFQSIIDHRKDFKNWKIWHWDHETIIVRNNEAGFGLRFNTSNNFNGFFVCCVETGFVAGDGISLKQTIEASNCRSPWFRAGKVPSR